MITCIEYIHPVAVDKYHCPFAFFIILWIIFQSKHHFNGPINCSLCSQKPFPYRHATSSVKEINAHK